jgi:hypothetical protein
MYNDWSNYAKKCDNSDDDLKCANGSDDNVQKCVMTSLSMLNNAVTMILILKMYENSENEVQNKLRQWCWCSKMWDGGDDYVQKCAMVVMNMFKNVQ